MLKPVGKGFLFDYIIVTKNPRIKMKAVLEKYRANKIIFDASNSLYHLKKWKMECEKMKQAYYVVSEEGAFMEEL